MSLPGAPFDVLVQVVFLEREYRVDLLHLERYPQGQLLVNRGELPAGHFEDGLAGTPTGLEIAAMADLQADVNERVVGARIRDHIMLSLVRPRTDASDREYSGGESGFMYSPQETVDVEPAAQIRGIFDNDMRHRAPKLATGRYLTS